MQAGKTPEIKDYYSTLNAPSIPDMQIQLQQLVEQGVLSPEEAETIKLDESAMNSISLDPRLQENQMAALEGLQEISDSGGMTAMDKANLNKIAMEEDAAAKGKRDAIIQGAQSRGMGGSGLELMAQLQNQQEATTRKATRDLDVAGMAQERALQALMQGGEMSGRMADQSFNQQAQVAGANDAISKFNAQNQQNQINQNVQARNAAQAANLQNKQNVANANAGLNNQQQMYNKNLIQQNYDNELKKRGGQTGVAQANAQAAGQNSQNQANATNQMIGTVIGAGASMYNPKKMQDGGMVGGDSIGYDGEHTLLESGEFVVRKDDVPEMLKKMHTDDDGEFDAAGFLDSITGHKYGYKKKGKSA